MRVGVFGASCRIGQEVTAHLLRCRHEVVVLGRRSEPLSLSFVSFDLHDPKPINRPDLDAVILIAWVGSPRDADSMRINREGYTRLAIELRRLGIFPVFISSVTATEESRSIHSRTKAEVEALFTGWGSVIRLGQVVERNGHVAGRSARVSSSLAGLGRILGTSLVVPRVRLSSVVRSTCDAAISYTVGTRDLIDDFEPIGGSSRIAIRISPRLIEASMGLLKVLPFRALNDIVDRYYALVDYCGRAGVCERKGHAST